jgi:hypothetical protein
LDHYWDEYSKASIEKGHGVFDLIYFFVFYVSYVMIYVFQIATWLTNARKYIRTESRSKHPLDEI